MPLPDSIKIGPYDYTVELVDNLHDGDKDLYGQIIHGDLVLKLNRAFIDSPRTKGIVWHEVVHGILEQTAHDDVPEEVIRVLGMYIAQAIEDNPWLRT